MSEEDEVLALALKDIKAPPDLTQVRNKAKELRDSYFDLTEAQARVNSIQSQINQIERQELIDLFDRVGIASVTVEAEGNHPAFVAERITKYGAKIPDEHRPKALEWFETQGHGDLIKAMVTVTFGMQEHEKRLALLELLASNGYECRSDETIHPQTLLAFVKREIKAGRIVPRDLLGVSLFDMVRIK